MIAFQPNRHALLFVGRMSKALQEFVPFGGSFLWLQGSEGQQGEFFVGCVLVVNQAVALCF